MAKITRYNGNLEAFATNASGTDRTVFGGASTSKDLTDNINAAFLAGWKDLVGPNDEPKVEDFSGLGFTLSQLSAYIHQVGVAEYDAAQEYHTGSVTNESGVLYRSLVDNNIGNTPSSDSGSNWIPVSDTPDITRESAGGYTWTQYKYPSGRLRLVFAGDIPVTSATTTNVTLPYPTSFVAVATEPHSVFTTNNNIIGDRNGYVFVTNGGVATSKDEVSIRYVATTTGTAGNCWTSITAEGRWK